MNAYLIDPHQQTVTAVDYDGSLHGAYKLMGVDLITTLYINNERDCIYLDDEGLFVDADRQAYFWWDGYPQLLAGRGLVVGTDQMGETVAPVCSLEFVQSKVRWQPKATAGMLMPDLMPEVYEMDENMNIIRKL